MNKKSQILITGARGLVGSAVKRELDQLGFWNLLTPSRNQLDLTQQGAVRLFFQKHKPAYVIHCAGRVGGIMANSTHQAEFLYENVTMATNVIHTAAENHTEKLLFLGSSCIYPKYAGVDDLIKEDQLLSGELEPTNEGYALSKIVGIKLCEYYRTQYDRNFIAAMPPNIYGPGDTFDPTRSHVIPALMKRFHDAKTRKDPSVTVWGTGRPIREFLHSQDLARAIVLLMEKYDHGDLINIGVGAGVPISALAKLMKEVTHYEGEITWDATKPDGTQSKVLNHSKMKRLGWHQQIGLEDGLKQTYRWAQDRRAI